MAPNESAPRLSPSQQLLAKLRQELMQVLPFSRMAAADVSRMLEGATELYFAPGEVLLQPSNGPVDALLWLRRGSARRERGTDVSECAQGELFPVAAALGGRAVTGTYLANGDCFCVSLPLQGVKDVAQDSAPLADFLNRRVAHFLELSRQVLQAHWVSQTLAQQSLETRLANLPAKRLLCCQRQTPLREALQQMHERRIGSIVVVDGQDRPLGILTRHDLLDRVTLPQHPLDAAIDSVMTAPVHSLDGKRSLHDAALLMAREGLRHVPVTEDGRLINLVSERDLFVLQGLSIRQLSDDLAAADDLATLRMLARRIRRFAAQLLAQGVQARQLTELISHLNDGLTARLVQQVAERRGLDLVQACWLAFGSEGREEQSISTDQDNGLIFISDSPDADRAGWLALAKEVNQGLDACGFPLCKGGVMASNPDLCLTPQEWTTRMAQWIEQGSPENLLKACIFFDMRPLCGNEELARPLMDLIAARASAVPRFIKQLALNALTRSPPLNWFGGLQTLDEGERSLIDLKLQGTALFVEAARVYGLAHAVHAVGTRERLERAAALGGVPMGEAQASAAAFEFLQMLRLRVQLGELGAAGGQGAEGSAEGASDHPNQIDIRQLNEMDLHMLKESLRHARGLQQRLALNYQR